VVVEVEVVMVPGLPGGLVEVLVETLPLLVVLEQPDKVTTEEPPQVPVMQQAPAEVVLEQWVVEVLHQVEAQLTQHQVVMVAVDPRHQLLEQQQLMPGVAVAVPI
jgi:hypothetical protein